MSWPPAQNIWWCFESAETRCAWSTTLQKIIYAVWRYKLAVWNLAVHRIFIFFMFLSHIAIRWDYIVTYIVHTSTDAPALIKEDIRRKMVKLALFCSSRKHLRNVLIEAREIPGKRNIYSRSHAAVDKHKGKSVLSAARMLGKKDGFMKADRVGFSAENAQLQPHTSLHHFILSHRTANVKRRKRTNTHTRIQISSQRETHRAVW